MRIQADQTIVGYPAVQVRQLMRETVGRSITLRYIQEILKCSDSSARQVMKSLEAEGLIEPVHDHFEPSMKGSALAMAKAAPPLRRETADRLITEVINRARAVNGDERWAYRVGRLVVFGSCARGVDRPNDVDIACELLPRSSGEKQRAKEALRREIRDEPFRNVGQWAAWPKLEVIRFLRARARGLSIQELDDWILQLEDHRIVLRDDRKTERDRQW
jgi:predicted nucleotidyltransferase